ncbi:CPBP family intramembrane glutamic endopeptidase [Salinimicrobium sediminilitoris]|uniref:CPBP family intramembrane glutamic endopeptidase n=1 Tax=Salinimicrobium sediminilitoris TaxID=2876715 RepID=UPI001E37CFCD|nr:CPBP family intramembrane glutamic endopeptidase [Salinimicrobium sediminilitoris]MCC8358311.1 CPBP family intramembrane metalloprotease [Salinimicrobium sediminilitoris]
MVQTSWSARGKREFWKRVFDIRHIGKKWLLLIFLIFPVILAVGYFILFLIGKEIPDFSLYFSGLDNFEAIVLFLVFMLLGGPLAEELGWRGFLLDPLQEKWGSLKASLIVGFFWLIWHLPLFLIAGTSQSQKGFGFSFWSWSLQIMVLSVIFTWIHNHTQKSILAAVLLHFMANFFYPLNLDAQGEIIFSVVRILIILPILISWSRQSRFSLKVITPKVDLS